MRYYRYGTAVSLVALLLAAPAFAQQEIVYSVSAPGWNMKTMTTRSDGKLPGMSFSTGVTAAMTIMSGRSEIGKPVLQEFIITVPLGDPTRLFFEGATRGRPLPEMLIEFPIVQSDPRASAPFAVKLKDVFVTGVTISKGAGDGGPGVTTVNLRPVAIEMFTATLRPDGTPGPMQRTGWDARMMRPL